MEQVKKTGPPIFRTAPFLFKMSLFILVGLAVCFSVGPILSSTLTYLEIRNLKASPYVSEYDYRWEKIAGIVVGIISIGLGIAGIVAVATVPHLRKETYYWLDGVMMCNLQILVSHNVRQSA
jgi:energy-converting hydrogenase Eha subunit G